MTHRFGKGRRRKLLAACRLFAHGHAPERTSGRLLSESCPLAALSEIGAQLAVGKRGLTNTLNVLRDTVEGGEGPTR